MRRARAAAPRARVRQTQTGRGGECTIGPKHECRYVEAGGGARPWLKGAGTEGDEPSNTRGLAGWGGRGSHAEGRRQPEGR
eukprot:442282-Lingulodinium_polyedra.AAC.1